MPVIKMQTGNSPANKRRMVAASGGYTPQPFPSVNSNRKYGGATSVNIPITKTAQYAGSGANVIFSQPMFFSPLHTPQNWQIAAKRREVYQWLYLPYSQVVTSNYTYTNIKDISFLYNESIEDVYTGGLLYENIDCEFLLGAKGKLKKPSRFAERDCKEKRCFEFNSYGYWHKLAVSEEHPIIVLDGKLYRQKKKIEANTNYRRKKGIVSNGVKKIKFPKELICRKEAQNVKKDDYLLAPLPEVGVKSINKDLAWTIGLCIADGTISSGKYRYYVRFIHEKEESYSKELMSVLETSFDGKVGSVKHGNGNGWRTNVSTKQSYQFYTNYIVGKGNKKKFTHEVFDLDKESRLNLLGGYFDGDGSFNKKSLKLIANNYSCNMADQIYWLLLSCDISCTLNRFPFYGEHYDTSSEWIYRISIPSSEVPKLKPYLRSIKIPFNFKPKKQRSLRFFYNENGTTYLAQPISEIKEFLYSGKGYDLQVDPDRAFVASGYISSNCRFYYTNEPKVAAGVDFYCFEPNSQVLMANGTQKSISSVIEGDYVRSHDGSSNVVEKVHKRIADENMLRIKISGVSIGTMKVTKGHEILTEREGEIKFVPASSLSEGDYLLTPCNYESSDIHTVNNDFAWIVGVYAAEGCGIPYAHTSKKSKYSQYFNGVVFTLSIDEKDTLVQEIKRKVENIYPGKKVTIREVPEGGRIEVKVFGQDIADDMVGHCPGTAKFGDKKFINSVLKWNNENLKHLLSGYFAGDGCFNSKNGFQGVGVARKMMDQLANICDRISVEYSYTQTRLSKRNRQTIYNIRISRRACDIFNNLNFKYQFKEIDESKIRNIPYFVKGNYIYRKILNIGEYYYNGDVYDLTVFNKSSYVVHRVAVHNSNFSMNGFKLECKSKKILKYYEKLTEKLKLAEKLNDISHEYFLLGDVFPFSEIECPHCGGRNQTEDGELCRHPDGSFKSIKILNPDYIEVKTNPLASQPEYFLMPDEELRTLVQRREPRKVYENLPQEVIALILTGQPIPLSSRSTGHLKHNASPYGTYGSSMLQRLFTVLAYKTKIMTANWIVAERLILPVRVVKVGDKDRPATEEDLQDVVNQLANVANDPNLTIVTHHAFDYEYYGATGKIHNITQEIEQIGKEILDGLMLNQAILNGEMQGYSSAQVGVEVLIRRLENWRNKLKDWVEKNIFLPVAMMQGFVNEEESKELGETVYEYPELIFNDLQLRDKTNKIQSLMQLYDKGLVSAQTILEELGLDYDTEVEKLRSEQVVASAAGMMMPGQGGGDMGGMGGMGGDMGGMGSMPGADPTGGMGGDMGGGMGGMPGADMGMGGGMGGMPATAEALPKITKRGKGGGAEEEQEQAPPQMIKLTKLEQQMYKMLKTLNAPFPLFGQYAVKLPGEERPFTIDFAYPKVGVGLECLHPNTYVPTSKGTKKAKDIVIGELLIGRKGSPVKIIKKYINKSKGVLLNIKALGINTIKITKNHPFLVCKSKKTRVKREELRITRTREYYIPDEPKFVKASMIEKGDYLVIPKNRQISRNYVIKDKLYHLNKYNGKSHNANKIPNKVSLNEEFGWLMGMYAAEGCSSGVKNKVVSFLFHIDEVDFSDKVQYLLEKIFGLKSSVRVNIKNNMRQVTCCCTSLGKFLLESFGHKAPNKRLPYWMFESSVECKEAFMEAFCQGDGCVRKENGINRYVSSSQHFLIDLQALSFSIGKFATICQSRKPGKVMSFVGKNKKYITAGLWEVDVNPSGGRNRIYREDDDYFYVPVNSIFEEEYQGDVINFETEGEGDNNHTYLVSNIITHNCDGSIWHQREDFVKRDQARDQKLANVGWRILRFKENAIEQNIDAVKDIVYKNMAEASKDLKKRAEDQTLQKFAAVPDYINQYKDDEIGMNTIELPHGLGKLILIGTVANDK